MVTVIPDPSGLAQGIIGAGSALGQALAVRGQRQYQEQQRERERQLSLVQQQQQQQQQMQYGTILQNTLGSLPENPSPIQVTQALSQAIQQGAPPDLVQKYGALYTSLQKLQPGGRPEPQDTKKMSELFKKFGMSQSESERNAELWEQLTTGGQTEMAKYLVDQIARGQYGGDEDLAPGGRDAFREEAFVSDKEEDQFKYPKLDIFKGRTPKEKTALKTQLLKENKPDYKESGEKIRSADGELLRINQLERLNDSGKLPEGLGRLNVNWTTGNIRIPALANEETQLFVKTINDFTVAAKDSYGARVTNFELGTFMKRLPTLANTEEGRRLILAQMKSMKELDRLYEDSLRTVYDKYGLQGIDRQEAEKIARQLRSEDEKVIKSQVAESVNAQRNYSLRQKAPEGTLPVRKPNGQIGYLPFDQIERAKKRGWKVL